ncbi:ATP-dependent DNA helicase, partial [Komagataeibacter sp. FXV2]|nr:ATP-dependent DNA helicase [Komagataeibacter sp. FXV2]
MFTIMTAPPSLPDTAPALIVRHDACSVLTPDGEILSLSHDAVRRELAHWPAPVVIHAPATARRLDLPPPGQPTPWLDLLELFAFAMPARTVPPTVRGLARALDFPLARIESAEADLLLDMADDLLGRIARQHDGPHGPMMAALAFKMRQMGWAWGESVCHALRVGAEIPAEQIQP